MDPVRWSRVQALYFEALEQPAATRRTWLAAACPGDPELHREVEGLLEAAEADDPLLDAGLDDLLPLLGEDDDGLDAPAPPVRAGPWAVEDEIGRGGMATVYRARRADGEYDREVALKVVHLAASPEEVVARVRREGRILASLDHPNIARLYDTGILDDGRPWLAMELVHGEPIDVYCDRLRLPLARRLALFEQVVAAVEHAHRRLVIHRDLKPSNILVDHAGEARLLDFGIARLLDPEGESEDANPLTRPDRRLLTPEYASPEQLRGEPLSTATDIWSLGVVLHRLLVGGLPSGFPPTSPSRRVDTVERAAARATTPDGLRRQLRGELDALVLAALRPEADARYPSAAALLDDLVRYRTGRPLSARPPSPVYRLRKFVGRNRVPVAAGAVALLGLLGGSALAVDQARRAREERDVAREATRFLEALFTASDPFQPERLDTLRVGAFLERGADRLEAEVGARSELRVRMQGILGSVLASVGAYPRGRALLEEALAGYRAAGEGDGPEAIRVLEGLGGLLLRSGDPLGAEGRYREALALATARGGEDSDEARRLKGDLASTLLGQERLDEAEALLRDAVLEERGGVDAVEHLNLLASLQFRRGRVDEAIVTMREGVDRAARDLGESHPGTAILTFNLGMALQRGGRIAEADSAMHRAVARLETALGPDNPQVARARLGLANVLEAGGRWSQADPTYARALADLRRGSPLPSQDLATALHDYGGALVRQGALARAAPLLEEALVAERAAMGEGSPGAGIILGAQGDLERRRGDPAAAETRYREGLAVLGAVFPPGHPRVLALRRGLGLTLGALGRDAEAEALLMEVLRESEALTDGGAAARAAAGALAEYHEERGDVEAAARWRQAASGSLSR